MKKKPTGDSRRYDKRAASTRQAAFESRLMAKADAKRSQSSQRRFRVQLAAANTRCWNCRGPAIVWTRGFNSCAQCPNVDESRTT